MSRDDLIMCHFLRRKREGNEMDADTKKHITFTYRNWRGETSERTAVPIELWFGHSEWHPNDQWFMRATDIEKGDERDFALADIKFSNSSQ
jgi:predicted DNA-binding transcriptional regulator YafY